MQRRDFLVHSGLALGVGAVGTACATTRRLEILVPDPAGRPGLDPWEDVRAQFNLSREHVELSAFFLASHPRPVRDAIQRHRDGLDAHPYGYQHENNARLQGEVLIAAAEHLGVKPEEIGLTDSTTMGLGLLYGGLKLREGQEILTTEHDHYAAHMALELRAQRTGVRVAKIRLYEDGRDATVEGIVQAILGALTPKTRVLAVTWVHSSTGVKLPIRRIADVLADVNKNRDEGDRVLLCVDGVHGLGAEDVTLPELGCDFFVAGGHKWIFGPRGTGIVWGRAAAWPNATATIPPFSGSTFAQWIGTVPKSPIPPNEAMTPGGFHSFEHRWALADAFRFHAGIGKRRIQERIRDLNDQIKEGLAKMPNVRLHTPRSPELSAGIVAFEVDGRKSEEVVARLWGKHRIGASVAPYASRYVRYSGSLLTNPPEIDRAIAALREVA